MPQNEGIKEHAKNVLEIILRQPVDNSLDLPSLTLRHRRPKHCNSLRQVQTEKPCEEQAGADQVTSRRTVVAPECPRRVTPQGYVQLGRSFRLGPLHPLDGTAALCCALRMHPWHTSLSVAVLVIAAHTRL